MSLPTLSGVGRLTDDPELRFTPQGKAVCKVRIAFSSRRKNLQTEQWEDGDQYFVDGAVWEQAAENVAESLTRGMEVFVTGRLKQRQYEKDGQKRTAYDLMIDAIGPTLRYATASVKKLQRSGGDGQAAPASQSSRSAQASGGGVNYADPWATSGPTQQAFGDEPPF